MANQVTLELPDELYLRLQQTANSMGQSFEKVILRAVSVGSPPSWEDVPAEFQADLASLDRLDDDSLWSVARAKKDKSDMHRYEELLEKNSSGTLLADEKNELATLRREADVFMLRKAQAASLLRWRGYTIPPAKDLQ